MTGWTDSPVANGTTYYYQVSAVNSVGEGALSNERSATPVAPATAPGAPTLDLGVGRQRQRRARLERAVVERRLGDHRLQGLPRHLERRRDAAHERRQRHRLDRRLASRTGRPTTTRSPPSTPSARAPAPASARPRRPRPRPSPARRPSAPRRAGTGTIRSPGAPRPPTAAPRSPATGSTAARRAAARPSSPRSATSRATRTRARRRHHLLLPGQRRELRRRGPALQRALREAHQVVRRPAGKPRSVAGEPDRSGFERPPPSRNERLGSPVENAVAKRGPGEVLQRLT